MLRRALVRPPAATFAQGLTTAGLGPPDLGRALDQHGRYCEALERCGVALTRLPSDAEHPDSTFVEDTAVVLPGGVVLARPGAPSRAGEVDAVRAALAGRGAPLREIVAPGTLDGGDICDAGDTWFLGVSLRTNEEGARQLARFLAEDGCEAVLVDIRDVPGLLHLKSAIASPGDGRLVLTQVLAGCPEFRAFRRLVAGPGEEYAANCIRVNDALLVASGFPRLEAALRGLGYNVLPLDMSEFRKMDGGLSCLSLRFETDPWED